MKELLAIGCDATHIFGAAFTPRHQGMGERGHTTMSIHHNLLMNAVCRAFPQEWPTLLPAVEYLCFTRGRVPGAGMTLVICEVGAAYVRYKMTVFPQMKGL